MTWLVDRAPAIPGWEPHETRDTDGKRIAGREPGDWIAWIVNRVEGQDPGYMMLQFGSVAVPTMAEAEQRLLAVIAGLNGAKPSLWRTQKEANQSWSVYEGEAFRKGGFPRQEPALDWIITEVPNLAPEVA